VCVTCDVWRGCSCAWFFADDLWPKARGMGEVEFMPPHRRDAQSEGCDKCERTQLDHRCACKIKLSLNVQ